MNTPDPTPQNAMVTEKEQSMATQYVVNRPTNVGRQIDYFAQVLADYRAAAVAEATRLTVVAFEESQRQLAQSEAECKQASKERDDATARLTDAKQAWLDSADPAKSPYIAFEDHQEQLTSVSAERDAANDALMSARAELGSEDGPFLCDQIKRIKTERDTLREQVRVLRESMVMAQGCRNLPDEITAIAERAIAATSPAAARKPASIIFPTIEDFTQQLLKAGWFPRYADNQLGVFVASLRELCVASETSAVGAARAECDKAQSVLSRLCTLYGCSVEMVPFWAEHAVKRAQAKEGYDS